ncbi:hypothetical protein CDAR_182261 [Caerostris darwini]|uniref:Uncharacterized protein n=1 Tax=Caerostris darwini TaxID=1538125 RepID=A0AAV4U5I3_9ARAC|nr:hypothetical protein CDAR_182261 [Caerostris darwini]
MHVHISGQEHSLADGTETERNRCKSVSHRKQMFESESVFVRAGQTSIFRGGLSLLFIALSARDPTECQPQNTSRLSPARGNHAGWVR